MTKGYSILQKKLQELESILCELLSLPPETPFNYQIYAQDIDQRFKFVRKLLSAEIASHPRKPYRLQHIARRLTELETVYKERDMSLKALTVLDHFEPVSTCSNTESRLNDDGEEGNGYVSPETEKFYQSLVEEESVHAIKEKEIGSDGDQAAEREEKRVWVVGKYFAGIVLGLALIGLVSAMFSGCFHYVGHNNFILTPT